MKSQKFDKKLTLNKLTVSSLNNVTGGSEAETNPCPTNTCPSLFTCYQRTCLGWSRCPDTPC